jgi:flagellar hook-length control protein FliK
VATAVDPAVPVAKPASAGQTPSGNAGDPDQQPKPNAQAPAAAAAPSAQQARVAAAYAPPAERPQPTAAVAPTAPTTATAPAAPATTALPTATPVPLARSAEAVEHVLRLASARGVTHARIALHPEELGSVDVHIRSTNEGIVARVVAHSAESVQTLQHAANDLRKSLEEQGVNVLSLDIGQSQSDDRSAGRSGTEGGGLARGDGEPADEQDSTETQTSTLRLPSGVLVDVLA